MPGRLYPTTGLRAGLVRVNQAIAKAPHFQAQMPRAFSFDTAPKLARDQLDFRRRVRVEQRNPGNRIGDAKLGATAISGLTAPLHAPGQRRPSDGATLAGLTRR